MHNRPIDAADTVSLAYPRMGSNAGSSIYYASLATSVHKINGTRKRAQMMDDISSMAPESMSDVIVEEEDPEEILKRQREEAAKYKKIKGKSQTMISKLKEQLSRGELSQEEFNA